MNGTMTGERFAKETELAELMVLGAQARDMILHNTDLYQQCSARQDSSAMSVDFFLEKNRYRIDCSTLDVRAPHLTTLGHLPTKLWLIEQTEYDEYTALRRHVMADVESAHPDAGEELPHRARSALARMNVLMHGNAAMMRVRSHGLSADDSINQTSATAYGPAAKDEASIEILLSSEHNLILEDHARWRWLLKRFVGR
jgi:hypothetical protein